MFLYWGGIKYTKSEQLFSTYHVSDIMLSILHAINSENLIILDLLLSHSADAYCKIFCY